MGAHQYMPGFFKIRSAMSGLTPSFVIEVAIPVAIAAIVIGREAANERRYSRHSLQSGQTFAQKLSAEQKLDIESDRQR